MLTSKEILQRLPTALAQIKAGKKSENLVNEVRQIIYFLYQAKEITEKLLYIYYYNIFTIRNYYTFTIHGKIFKTSCKNTNLKYQLQHGMKNLNYLIDHILYQILKITLNISLKT